MDRPTDADRLVGAGLLAVAAVAVWRGLVPPRGAGPAPPEAEPATVAPGPLGRFDALQRRVGWLGFALAVVKRFGEHGAGRLAAVVAYYAFFSVFPLLLALVTVLGFVLEGNDELRQRLLDTAVAQIPVIGPQIADATNPIGGSGLALAVGLGATLWAGMGAMVAAQHAFNTVWDVPRYARPKLLVSRARALVGLLVLGLGVFGTTAVAAVVTSVAGLPGAGRLGLVVLNLAVNVGVLLLAFRVLTARPLTWSQLLPGAVVGGLGYLVLQQLGTFLVDRYVTGASDTYGVFAVVIGLLSWFHLLGQVTVLSAEVNAVRVLGLHPRSWSRGSLTDGDRRALASARGAAQLDDRAVDDDEGAGRGRPPRR